MSSSNLSPVSAPRAYLTTEVRLHRDSAGRIRAAHNAAAYERWLPYREAFTRIAIVGRLSHDAVGDDGELVEGPGVEVRALPAYSGVAGLLRTLPALRRLIGGLGDRDAVFIGRIPEPLSILLSARARQARARFVTVLVIDPAQLGRGLWPGNRGRVAGRVLAGVTRRVIARSAAVVYVTRSWLQARYPGRPGTPTLSRSNVVLPDAAFVASPRSNLTALRTVRLVSIGTMGSESKGFDVMCRVVRILVDRGLDVRLTVLGGGSALPHTRAVAAAEGVDGRIEFTGHVDGADEVRRLLDAADVYVTTSRAEGLSRAAIEAMARGLPVVSTRAGGIEEVLDPADLAALDDAEAIAARIAELSTSAVERAEASARNLRVAHEIADSADPARLTAFLVDQFGIPASS